LRLEDRKKVYAQLLGKLYIPDEIDEDKLRTLMLLISNLRRVCLTMFLTKSRDQPAHVSQRRPLRDTTARNSLTRFESTLAKKFAAQLESFNEADFRQLEELKELSDPAVKLAPGERS